TLLTKRLTTGDQSLRMKRPWQVWLLFSICALAALVGMAWVTKQSLRADEHRRAAQADAELEQRVSLALWRMDTELAPIIAGEVIRSPAMYHSAFYAVSPPTYPNAPPNAPAQGQSAQIDKTVSQQVRQSSGPQGAPQQP